VPGLGFLVVKSELAKMSSSIRAIPRTFRLPEQYNAWQEFINTDAGTDMEWVSKNTGHRGVRIIPDPSAPDLQQSQNMLVQQLVRPHLIGGRSWDVGGCGGKQGAKMLCILQGSCAAKQKVQIVKM
jgi:hypothetical protein